MTTFQIIAAVLLGWILVGFASWKHANRAGYTFGWFPGAGIVCRLFVVLQTPALLLDSALCDLRGEHDYEGKSLAVGMARMLWQIFKNPALSPDDAFKMDEDR